MTTELTISAATERVKLDGQNRGEVSFTVTNSGQQAGRVVFETVPGDGADSSWFSVDEPQRRVDAGASVSYLVRIAVPTGTAASSCTLQGRVYPAETPPEEASRLSNRVAFDVAPSAMPRKPWWPYAVAAVLLLVVLGVIGWLVFGGKEEKPTGTLTVNVAGNGSVSSSPNAITCPSGCQGSYPVGTAVTLTATPASGNTFGSWQNCPQADGASCHVTIAAGAQAVSATFAVATFTINVQVFPGGGGIVTATGDRACSAECNFTYPVGTAVTLIAQPLNGFRFDGWAGACNTAQRTNPSCTLTFNQSTGVRAVFALIS